MATKEEISMVGFEIVAYAGDAQTDLLAALDAAREGDFEKAEQLHKDASDALIGAHDTQTKLLSQEAGGGEMEMTFIMAHAQDTLMTTMILEADPLYHRCLQAHCRARGQARLTNSHNQVPFQSPAAFRSRAFLFLLSKLQRNRDRQSENIRFPSSLGNQLAGGLCGRPWCVLPFGFSLGGYTSIRNTGRNEEVSKCRTTD